jgi:hypothetical protein
MSLFIDKNVKIGINSIDTHIYNAIHDVNNTISENQREIIVSLYNHFKNIILEGFVGKKIEDIHSVFWQNIILHMMISVEDLNIIGPNKKDLIIETICIIIRHDLIINDQDKVYLEKQFRKVATNIIDILIFGSKNLNKKYKRTHSWNIFKSYLN